jgi:hypothetical protein
VTITGLSAFSVHGAATAACVKATTAFGSASTTGLSAFSVHGGANRACVKAITAFGSVTTTGLSAFSVHGAATAACGQIGSLLWINGHNSRSSCHN